MVPPHLHNESAILNRLPPIQIWPVVYNNTVHSLAFGSICIYKPAEIATGELTLSLAPEGVVQQSIIHHHRVGSIAKRLYKHTGPPRTHFPNIHANKRRRSLATTIIRHWPGEILIRGAQKAKTRNAQLEKMMSVTESSPHNNSSSERWETAVRE